MSTERPSCEHENFLADVDVNRLSRGEDGPIANYHADIRISCADCNLPFQFIGVPMGLSGDAPTSSVDLCELRAPIAPRGQPLLGGMPGFTVRVTND